MNNADPEMKAAATPSTDEATTTPETVSEPADTRVSQDQQLGLSQAAAPIIPVQENNPNWSLIGAGTLILVFIGLRVYAKLRAVIQRRRDAQEQVDQTRAERRKAAVISVTLEQNLRARVKEKAQIMEWDDT